MNNENRSFKSSGPFVMAWKGDIQACIRRAHKGLHIKNYERGDYKQNRNKKLGVLT